MNEDGGPSYHDLHITTPDIPRTRIFDLPYNLMVTCTRVSGWELWDTSTGLVSARLLGGEYGGPGHWLVLDVAGHVIIDSRPASAPARARAAGQEPGPGQPDPA